MSVRRTVTQPIGRRMPRTTHLVLHRLYTHRVMCHRDTCTEHPHIMKDMGRRTRCVRPTLTGWTTPTLMRKNFRRGRLPLCHITTMRIVFSIPLMAGRHTVTDTCCDEGRFCAGRPLLRWLEAFSAG